MEDAPGVTVIWKKMCQMVEVVEAGPEICATLLSAKSGASQTGRNFKSFKCSIIEMSGRGGGSIFPFANTAEHQS